MTLHEAPHAVGELLEASELAHVLEGDRFKQIVDRAPVAIAVAEIRPEERIVYCNDEFERLTGQPRRALLGGGWDRLPGRSAAAARPLSQAVVEQRDYLGCYAIPRAGAPLTVDAWTSVIEDGAAPVFRLVALVEATARSDSILEKLEEQVREKDMQLRELQHRVKNNLQMITALIRAEVQGVSDRSTGEGFERLAGRVEALGVLYRSLSESASDGAVELGAYLTQVASAVMRAHATEGIHLDLQVDNWPVSIDTAMPLGLVVNELMTNSLKHAFPDGRRGAISLHSASGPAGCKVLVADDGVGLPQGVTWPKPGKLSSMIVRSLLQNAKARIDIRSAPGEGTRVTFEFDPGAAARPS
ncbi:MAG TPA: histidine kinase dimerization/phosphoacceptor domain -containing protein [Caulobacteraceae bacterium]|nr:histidine kinase dimerization/phosphoacceptor domain -containing protein [Caulobacteraceae bacterium]